MTLVTVATSVIVAVKNGPPGMWRAMGSPSPAGPIDGFATSPLWMAVTTFGYLALAVAVALRARRARTAPDSDLVTSTAVLGLLVMVDLRVHSAALGLLVFVLVVAAWVTALRKADPRQARR